MGYMATNLLAWCLMIYWMVIMLMFKIANPIYQSRILIGGLILQLVLVWMYVYLIKVLEQYIYKQHEEELKQLWDSIKSQQPAKPDNEDHSQDGPSAPAV